MMKILVKSENQTNESLKRAVRNTGPLVTQEPGPVS